MTVKHKTRKKMLRYVPSLGVLMLSCLLSIHGIIHFVGYNYPDRLLWIITAFLLLASAIGCYRSARWWIGTFTVSLVLSQVLMIRWWDMAKVGFFLNIVLLFVALAIEAAKRVDAGNRKLVSALMKKHEGLTREVITAESIRHLPAPVQRWLKHSGIIDRSAAQLVHLRQRGQLRLRPAGRWFDFRAEQYSIPSKFTFVWYVKVSQNAFVWLTGRDFLLNGNTGMVMHWLNLWTVAKSHSTPELEMAAHVRVLGEMAWCPSMALSNRITWKDIDNTTAQVTLQLDRFIVCGKFHFNEAGDMTGFSALRYYSNEYRESLRHWQVKMNKHREYHGLRLPSHYTITWKLPGGDYEWMNFELEKVDYDKPYLFDKHFHKREPHDQPVFSSDSLSISERKA